MSAGTRLLTASPVEGVEYCPVSIAAKLIGDRWTLLIVRGLMGSASRQPPQRACAGRPVEAVG